MRNPNVCKAFSLEGTGRQTGPGHSLPHEDNAGPSSSFEERDQGPSPTPSDRSGLTPPATPPTPERSLRDMSDPPRMANDSSGSSSADHLETLGTSLWVPSDALISTGSIGEQLANSPNKRPHENHDRSLSDASNHNGNVSTDNLARVTSNDICLTGNTSTDSLESYEIVPLQTVRTRRRLAVGMDLEQNRLAEDCVSPSIPPSDPPTAQDWDSHREIFTKLYRTEGRKLKDVRAIMEKRHGFHATERMYKKRIAEWGLRKYSGRSKGRTSSNESGSRRTTVGDQGNLNRKHRCLGRDVPVAQSQNQFALSRNRRALEQDLDSYLRSKEQSLSYARFRAISQDLEKFEIILTQIDNYYNSYSSSDWARTFPKTARASIKEIPLCFDMQVVTKTAATSMVRHPGEVFNRIHMAAELLRINTCETRQLAWRMIGDAFDMVKSVLVQQHPQLLRYLFMQFWDQTFDTHPEIRRHLFAITSEIAEVCLGPRHPITVISRLLPKINDGSQVCELAWKRNLDTFDILLGANHDESLRSKMALTGNLIDAYRYDDAERVLKQIVNLFEPESTAYYNRAALCRIAWLYKLQCNFPEAETRFIDVLHRCRAYMESNPGTTLDEVYLAATTHLAQIQARRDYQQGERLLQGALELCIRTMGPDHAYTYTVKTELGTWKQVAETDALLDDFVVSASDAT